VRYIVKSLVVATILASSAYAQEASQLSLGQPLLPKANIGEPYIRAENGDWAVRCVVMETGNDTCNMTQLILTEDNSPIAEISHWSFAIPKAMQNSTLIRFAIKSAALPASDFHKRTWI